MTSPSEKFHCQPCAFEGVESQNVTSQMLQLEASSVSLYIRRHVAFDEAGAQALQTEDVAPSVSKRHLAAQQCAETILNNECSLFITQQNKSGKPTLQPRPRGVFTGKLKAVE